MSISVEITDTNGPLLTRIETGLRDRKSLHTRIAGNTERFLKKYGREISVSRHRTAESLGANPTNHLAKAYAAIESEGKPEQAEIRMPRASRLRAGFGDYVARPGAGRTYLTIPATAATYGRRVGEFPEGTFHFAVFHGARITPVLLFTEDGLGHKKGEVAYWLKTEVNIAEDATLIPFNLLAEEAKDSIEEYIDDLRKGGPQS